jgi:cell division protease FtsH
MLDEEQQELTDLAMRRSRRLIEESRAALEELAAALLEHEVLERPDIDRIMAKHRPPDEALPLPSPGEVRIAATDPQNDDR